MTEDYDQQLAEDVFQTEELPPATIPVSIQGVVRVDEMPSRCFFRNFLLRTGANAELILPADPRRKRIIVWGLGLASGVETICVGEEQSSVQAFQAAHLSIGSVPLRYEIGTRENVWARPGVINETGGTFQNYGVSTDDAILSMIIEQWVN